MCADDREARSAAHKLGDPTTDEQAALAARGKTGEEGPRTTPVGSPEARSAAQPHDEDEWVMVSEPVHPRDVAAWALPAAARRLVDSLDRMAERERLSLNVRDERETVRKLLETLNV